MKKKIILIIGVLFLTISSFAQSPEKMSYQALIRNSADVVLSNKTVNMKISIVQSSLDGTIVYSETKTTDTNINGLVSIEIGSGLVVFGSFSLIDWSEDTSYFIKIETDIDDDSSYDISTTSQLLSVPYALYEKTSGSSTPGPHGADGVKGDTGATGTNGENGAQGSAGAAGAQGIPGDTGADGVKGDTGVAGTNGENGAQGAIGALGPQGLQGDKGDKGTAGAQGAEGQAGAAGNDATNFWTESGSDIYRTSGDVGVGTTKPSEKLDVVGNINSNGLYLNNQKLVTNDGFGRVEFFNANGQERIEFNGSNTHIQNAVVLIQESLKVGAGVSTSDPAANLEVVGTTRITSLSGTGDRMVVADEYGDLSTQAIASGPQGIQGDAGPAGADGLLTDGTQDGQMNYWNGTTWQTINPGNAGAVLQMVGTTPTWVSNADIVAPVIKVTSGIDIVEQGATWTNAGATADTGETVTTSGTVDTNTAGTYTVTYTATDASGNAGTATRTVIVYATTLNADGTRIVWANYTFSDYSDAHPSPWAPSLTAPEGYEIILYVEGSGSEEYNTNTNIIPNLLQLLQGAGNIDGKAYAGLRYIGPDRGPNGNWSPWTGSYTWGAYAVDTTAPVVTVTSGTDTVGQGSTWTDAGATADTGETVTASGTVDTNTVGIYTITYTATDAAGNVGTATRTVTVLDTTAPVVTVTSGTDTVAQFSSWTDAGATADTGESVIVSGAVDNNTGGAYTIAYTATDAAGNIGTATRTVTVVDNTAPVVTITSATDTLAQDYTWTDVGATVDTGESVVVSGTVDTSIPGTYTITYTATDASGNIGTATRTVTVIARIITLNYTGSAQTFTVPAGVSTIQVEVVAAAGGMPGWGINHPRSAGYTSNKNYWATVTDASRAGKGGKITADFDVSSLNGQTLQINVGGEGAWGGTHYSNHNVGSNAFNGGGRGDDVIEYQAGGGASDIRIGSYTANDRIIVAGAGGASSMKQSGGWYTFVAGGAGGGQTGGTGTQGANGYRLGGTGGSQIAGGLGGSGGYSNVRPYGGDTRFNGDYTGLGNGGNGDMDPYPWLNSGAPNRGAGGGGGYHGGGAGTTGGGGSSYTSGTYFSNVSDTQGFWPNTSSAEYSSSNSHGYIKITIL
jgi:hypothetical protein